MGGKTKNNAWMRIAKEPPSELHALLPSQAPTQLQVTAGWESAINVENSKASKQPTLPYTERLCGHAKSAVSAQTKAHSGHQILFLVRGWGLGMRL